MARITLSRNPLPWSGLIVRLAFGLSLSLVTLWWAMRDVDLSALLATLQAASLLWVLAAFGISVLVGLTKTARWQVLYGPVSGKVRFERLFSVLMIAQMINVLIPIRLGEIIRIGLMKQTGQPAATTASTVLIEKTLDFMAAGIMASLLVALTVTPGWLSQSAGSVLFVGVSLFAGLFLLWGLRDRIERWVTRGLNFGHILPEAWRTRLLSLVQKMLASLGLLADWISLSGVLLWTAVIWMLSLLTTLALFYAFDINLTLAAVVVMTLAAGFSNLAPSPGLVGVVPALAVAVLDYYQVAAATAFGFGLMLNAVMVVPLVVLGCWAIWPRFVGVLALFSAAKAPGHQAYVE